MSCEELPPGRSAATRRRRNAMASEYASDRGGRDPITEVEELALDPAISPAWILAAKSQDEIAKFIGDGRSSSPWSEAKRRPAPPHEFAMPPEQRRRREEKSEYDRGQPGSGGRWARAQGA